MIRSLFLIMNQRSDLFLHIADMMLSLHLNQYNLKVHYVVLGEKSLTDFFISVLVTLFSSLFIQLWKEETFLGIISSLIL